MGRSRPRHIFLSSFAPAAYLPCNASPRTPPFHNSGEMFKSIRKRDANRANAQNSTGPVTAEGKAAVARNAVKHGLTGSFHVLEGEDQQAYTALLNRFMEDEKPVGIAEIELVKKMAQYTWLSDRAIRFQEACFVILNRTPEMRAKGQAELQVRPDLERYTRYQAHHNREYQRASKELRDRRKEREKSERGFVSQKQVEAKETRAAAREARAAEMHPYQLAIAKTRAEAPKRSPKPQMDVSEAKQIAQTAP